MGGFKKENRYFVFKRKKLSTNQKSKLYEMQNELSPNGNVKECLVIESDWDCYDSAWLMVSKIAEAKFTDPYEEITRLQGEVDKANERVKELEKDLANKELLHVGFTNGSQINYAKAEEGAFYPNTDGDCYIPLYMLKSHEHRIETTSIEQLRKEQE